MAEYKIQVGEHGPLAAEIDDPNRPDWTATLTEARSLGAGVWAVLMLDEAGKPKLYSEADVVPAGPEAPTRLEGKLPFHK